MFSVFSKGSRLSILSYISSNDQSSSKSRVGGNPIPGSEVFKKKTIRQRQRFRRNPLPNEDFRLESLYHLQTSSLFFKFYDFYLQITLFELYSSDCIFKLRSSNSSFNFNLHASFARLPNSKLCPFFLQISPLPKLMIILKIF